MMRSRFCYTLFVLVFTSAAHASPSVLYFDSQLKIAGQKSYASYFSVSEIPQATTPQAQWSELESRQNASGGIEMDPWSAAETLLAGLSASQEIRVLAFNLLQLVHHEGPYGVTNVPYNRLNQFGTWIRDRESGECFNTRARVLMRDSRIPVAYAGHGCTVARGEWHDPYSGQEFSEAQDVQIDHFVPLKNAFVSGAWRWDDRKRCLYANFMGNNFHLLAVNGRENMRKSDMGPEGYLPPDMTYRCQYIEQWMKVKLIWQLGLNPDEARVAQSTIQANHCELANFQMSVAELEMQRKYIQDHAELCAP